MMFLLFPSGLSPTNDSGAKKKKKKPKRKKEKGDQPDQAQDQPMKVSISNLSGQSNQNDPSADTACCCIQALGCLKAFRFRVISWLGAWEFPLLREVLLQGECSPLLGIEASSTERLRLAPLSCSSQNQSGDGRERPLCATEPGCQHNKPIFLLLDNVP